VAVVEAVARQALEAVEEQPLRRGPLGAVGRLALQDRERGADVEPARLFLRLPHDEGLEGGEVVRQPRHGGGERAHELEFAHEVVERHRQLRGRQHLLADRHERLLGRDSRGDPLGERPEQVCLFDAFLTVEHGRIPVAGGGADDPRAGASAERVSIL
jgi:hypothetical protein